MTPLTTVSHISARIRQLPTTPPPALSKSAMQPRATFPRDVLAYYTFACSLTWLLALPALLAWMRHEAPAGGAVACAGLSAFGPLIAATVIAAYQGRLRDVFGRWRGGLVWIALALAIPLAIRVLAAALTALLGFELSQWIYPPSEPTRVAALVVFPLGEEFGWRGFAQPRLTDRYGLVKGTLVVGVMWGFWHLAYGITPEAGTFDLFVFLQGMVELPLYSLILTWVFEKGSRSMAIPIAFHAAAHLNHIELAPRTELGFHALHLAVVAIVAVVAVRALAKRDREAAVSG